MLQQIELSKSRAERINELSYDYSIKPKTRVKSCNLCGSSQFVVISHVDRYGYNTHANGCLNCSLVFINPVMDNESYGEFYEDVYRPLVSAYHGRLIDHVTVQEEQVGYTENLIEYFQPFLNDMSSKRFLDIGGSTGVIAEGLKNQFDMKGLVLDPSPDELREAERKGLETHASFLEDFDPGDKKFSLIVMCQTIDHLLDISTSLKKVYDILAKDGLFFVDILDFRGCINRYGNIEQAIKIDHPYYLSELTMEAYFRKFGFEIVSKIFEKDPLHVGYLVKKSLPEETFLPSKDEQNQFWNEFRVIQTLKR